jgi:nitrite reductase/ring-hydroxylating ferredoxin subunit
MDRYVDRLLRRRRPKPFAPTEDELAVLRTAIDLMAAAPDAEGPRPAFVDRLRGQLAAQEGAERGGEAPRPAWRIPPRRRFLAAGALTAAGAAAGVAADQILVGGGASGAPAEPQTEISPISGIWHTVVSGAELPEGAVMPFDLGAVNGFLRRVSGRVQAVSGICTHQGCRLDLAATRDMLSCPCHGATFTLAGANVAHPLQTGQPLPALPRLPVREQSGLIQVYAPRSG